MDASRIGKPSAEDEDNARTSLGVIFEAVQFVIDENFIEDEVFTDKWEACSVDAEWLGQTLGYNGYDNLMESVDSLASLDCDSLRRCLRILGWICACFEPDDYDDYWSRHELACLRAWVQWLLQNRLDEAGIYSAVDQAR